MGKNQPKVKPNVVNVTTTFKDKDGKETKSKGNFVDANVKTSGLPKTVGVNLGITLNMGNYQSMRIDVWSTDKIRSFETRQDAIYRVANDCADALQVLRDNYE